MSFLLYEVWTEDEDGHQELVETTASLTGAKRIAQKALEDGSLAVVIYQETEDGDTREIQRMDAIVD
jgi:hypothetical protein